MATTVSAFGLLFGLLSVIVVVTSGVDLAAVCSTTTKTAIPDAQKGIYEHLCQLQTEIIELQAVITEMVTGEGGAPDENVEQHSAEKRKNEFIRFGKRKNEFIRFGKRKNEFIRFGKRKNEFIRFGRSAEAADDDSTDPMMSDRMEKRKNEFIRFG